MKKNILIALNIVALLALAGATTYFYMKQRDLNTKYQNVQAQYDELKNNPEAAKAAEVQRYIDEVGKVYDLPEDEEPSVATVSDKEQLKDQPFFEKAENGDVTLIYSNAKLAILYRPSTQQIVNVSTVTIEDNEETSQGTDPAGTEQSNE